MKRPFHLLAKPTGATCNLDCTYCFFLSKDALYPAGSTKMRDDTLEAYVTQLIDAQPDGEVNVAWQGGEPTLMGVEFFRRALTLAERSKRPAQNLVHSIQTNGTLLDAEWLGLFSEHRVLVGLSIDGPADVHDRFRVTKNGSPTHARVEQAWFDLRRADIETNVLCSLSAANVDLPLDVYRYFRDTLSAEHVQFIPIVERADPLTLELAERGWSDVPGRRRILYRQEGNVVTSRSITGRQYGDFLVTVYDEWLRHDVGRVFVQLFDVTLGSHLGIHTLCVHSPTCGDALALEHNGDVYSCDHFVEPDHLLGNIHETPLRSLVDDPRQVAFGQHKSSSLPRMCRECDVRFACHGGCPKDRFATTPDGEAGLNHLCEGYQTFFRHSGPGMRRMAELVASGRYADEIMNDRR
ncbi:MAG: hypothetical protein RL547_2064 [Actinomycetota bacterium]